jgi:hypothetical protein
LGFGDDPEEEMYKWLSSNFGEGAENWVRFGIAGIGGRGVSLKGSLAIGVMDVPTTPKDFLGAPGSIVADIYRGGINITKGDYVKGLEKLLPLQAAGSMVRSVREYTQGVTTKRGAPVFYGNRQLQPDLIDSVLRFAAFNPANIAGKREKQWKEKRIAQKYKDRKHDIYSKMIRFYTLPLEKRTKAKWIDIQFEIMEFNATIRDRGLFRLVPPITEKSIKASLARSFRPSKRERQRQ